MLILIGIAALIVYLIRGDETPSPGWTCTECHGSGRKLDRNSIGSFFTTCYYQ